MADTSNKTASLESEKDHHGSEESSDLQINEHASEFNLPAVLALIASALAYFCTVGLMNAFGVFQQYYTVHYLPEYSNFQISWIGSFAQFMLFAFAAPAGLLADRFGVTVPVSIGSIMLLVAIFMVSLCQQYYQFFLAQAVLLSIGMSLVAIPASTIVPKHFKRHVSLAQGISIGGSSLGGVVWPIVLDQLLYKDNVSFGWSMRIVGFIMIPLLALVLVGLRPPRQAPISAETSAELGRQTSAGGKKKNLSKLKSPVYILLCLGLALACFGFLVPIYFISVYATSLGVSEDLAFYLISILNAASLFGRVLPGIVADRYGIFNILTLAAFTAGVVTFCMTQATTVAGLVVWALAYGFTSGAILSLQLAAATALSDDGSRGAAIGILMASVSLTGLFGAPIAGELTKHGYLALSSFAGATLIAGGVLMGGARFVRNRKLMAKV